MVTETESRLSLISVSRHEKNYLRKCLKCLSESSCDSHKSTSADEEKQPLGVINIKKIKFIPFATTYTNRKKHFSPPVNNFH